MNEFVSNHEPNWNLLGKQFQHLVHLCKLKELNTYERVPGVLSHRSKTDFKLQRDIQSVSCSALACFAEELHGHEKRHDNFGNLH